MEALFQEGVAAEMGPQLLVSFPSSQSRAITSLQERLAASVSSSPALCVDVLSQASVVDRSGIPFPTQLFPMGQGLCVRHERPVILIAPT